MVFGEDAELYDKARAAYPAAVVDHVLAYAGRGTDIRALEVGAGTGKATVVTARRQFPIVALEPDEAMAAVARRNCGPFPNVEIHVTTFEDWPVKRKGFDLLFPAQAWHWVDPALRYVKGARP